MSREKPDIKENIDFIFECPSCSSTNIVKAGKAPAGFQKIQAYICANCNKTLLDGEIIKRPVCPACTKPMRKAGNKNFLGEQILRFRCDDDGIEYLAELTRKLRINATPKCPQCNSRNLARIRTQQGHRLYQCLNCGSIFWAPLTKMLEIEEIDGIILKRKKWIKADPSSLPRILRLAIETLDQYYIDEALKITDHLPCPYCGSRETIFDDWKKWGDGRRLRRHKCKKCGRKFTPYTYIRLAWKEVMPCCPKCHSNENVRKYGKVNGIQYYFCDKCKRKFTENTSVEGLISKILLALKYVSRGISMFEAAHEANKSERAVPRACRLAVSKMCFPRIKATRGRDVYTADEKKVKICGKQRYLWGFMHVPSRYITYSGVTLGRGEKDALIGLIMCELHGGIKIFVSDGHPAYSRAMHRLYAPRLVTVFWNKKPREGFPLDWRDVCIVIDDYGDFVVVSIGADRLIPVGRFRVVSEEDMARLIMHFSFECTVIIVNSRRNMRLVVDALASLDTEFVYHFVCGKGYQKAYIERFLKEVKRRIEWFDGNFRDLESADRFAKLYALRHNWLRYHRTLRARPAEVLLGLHLPGDSQSVIEFVFSLKKIKSIMVGGTRIWGTSGGSIGEADLSIYNNIIYISVHLSPNVSLVTVPPV